ncbi:MAG: response regulator [Cryomorphaceae bacterium]|nr:response regulator [Cryomorphaceae bacterium]
MIKKSICIIDDDPTNVLITKALLNLIDSQGFMLTYSDGKEAYDGLMNLCKNDEALPEVYFLDINMPIWDGWDFLDEVAKLNSQKPVSIFVLSSSNNPEDAARALTYNNVKGYLVKPVTLEVLKKEFDQI